MTQPKLMPYLYYPDATVALDFLVDAFGFAVRSAIRDRDGTVLTAQVQLDDAIVMIGPGVEAFGTRPVPDPDLASSRTFVYVDDVEEHCEHARARGAVIRDEPHLHFNGKKIYLAIDCGGQQWIFSEGRET